MIHATPARFQSVHDATDAAPVPSLHIAASPASGLGAVVIIPVKDEAENLPLTLAALAAQVDLAGQPLPAGSFEVIVLANNCLDQSAAVARRFAQAHPALTIHVAEILLPAPLAHIGWARRLLMDEACRRLELAGATTGYIASTDGDTQVAPTWLAATRAELTTYQTAAVCGRILTPEACQPSRVRRCQLRDAAYRLLSARLEAALDPNAADPWPRHHQHFGASFAITVAAYRLVGGLPVVPYLEDEALFQALLRHDLSVRHSPAVRVSTSDRQEGRVAVGLSWQLREWATLGTRQHEPLVAGVPSLVAAHTLRRQLRQLWQSAHVADVVAESLATRQALVESLAFSLSISTVTLALHLRHAASFGALWEWVEQGPMRKAAWSRRWQPVPLTQALHELRQLLSKPVAELNYTFSSTSSR
ncbi:glycosyltransferase [Hymenobacter sp. BT635]|uniref:Glycosyltransferase n=1 Tax=Hymenobacter nitidus TaxID=2880929 RepID=A0ABS8AGA8_9BACT|nr:glycosyltransferase [Hymenobacter nitidus]MCB2379382.1 glycosyltransferase [Hymenobacter nitidus]